MKHKNLSLSLVAILIMIPPVTSCSFTDNKKTAKVGSLEYAAKRCRAAQHTQGQTLQRGTDENGNIVFVTIQENTGYFDMSECMKNYTEE